jgi:hypothetical protein
MYEESCRDEFFISIFTISPLEPLYRPMLNSVVHTLIVVCQVRNLVIFMFNLI